MIFFSVDLGVGEETVFVEKTQVFVLKTVQINNKIPLQVELRQVFDNYSKNKYCNYYTVKIVVERGLPFIKAIQLKEQSVNPDDGFYLSNEDRISCRLPILALSTINLGNMRKSEQLFRIYRPNTGLQQRHETLESLRKKYAKVRKAKLTEKLLNRFSLKISPNQAQTYWDELYFKAAKLCIHAIRYKEKKTQSKSFIYVFRQGHCPTSSSNQQQICEVGLRSRRLFVLSGSVLALWSPMERILPEGKIQMIRIKTTPIHNMNNQTTSLKIVGCIIPKRCLSDLIHLLESSSTIT